MRRLFPLIALLGVAAVLVSCATTGSMTAQARTEPATGNPNTIRNPDQPVASPKTEPVPNLPMLPPVAEPDKVVEKVPSKDGVIDWGAGIIRATGKSAANTARGQEFLAAERAATVIAQRNLLEIAKGVRVNGETVVEDLMLKNDFIVTSVEGIVKGARQVGETRFDSVHGFVSVELMMKLYGADGISDAVRPDVVNQPAAEPVLSQKGAELLAKYSAIIVEGAGTNAKPALFPRLVDEKGNLIVDTRDLVAKGGEVGRGAIQFVESASQIVNDPRWGNNPLIIKVKEFQGKYLSDYVIPKQEADLLKTLIKDVGPWLLKAGRFLFSLLLL